MAKPNVDKLLNLQICARCKDSTKKLNKSLMCEWFDEIPTPCLKVPECGHWLWQKPEVKNGNNI